MHFPLLSLYFLFCLFSPNPFLALIPVSGLFSGPKDLLCFRLSTVFRAGFHSMEHFLLTLMQFIRLDSFFFLLLYSSSSTFS